MQEWREWDSGIAGHWTSVYSSHLRIQADPVYSTNVGCCLHDARVRRTGRTNTCGDISIVCVA